MKRKIPILGIYFGGQLLARHIFGKYAVQALPVPMSGSLLIKFKKNCNLFRGLPNPLGVVSTHYEGFIVPKQYRVAEIEEWPSYAFQYQPNVYGIQFHPEVVHTEQGTEILKNFVLKVCGAKQDWTMEGFIDSAIEKISKIKGNVLCGVSGGIDSTVTALLIHKAIGNRQKCVFVNNGLLRLNEEIEIEEMFKNNFNVNFSVVNAAQVFLAKLKGVEDPERKRMIIGEEFVRVFTEFAKKNGPFKWLAQGTLYPDVIESGVSKGPAAVIKSHHNVGGLPDWLDLEILEPLRDLYKDEVRKIAKILGVPEKLFMRHPFPGPGLAVRIIGEVTPTKLQISKVASKIVEDELIASDLYGKVWQAYAAVGDDKAVGVVGDERKYGNIVMIRVVDSIDAMTADWTRLPHELLEKISNRITNEVEDVTWVTYAISSKPPATIEPQ